MASDLPEDLPLGRRAEHPERYAPAVLRTVERGPMRETLGLGRRLPFRGRDVWTAWELSWLNRKGRPEVAVARLDVPADSPRLVESKSLKLYLGSFAQTTFAGRAEVRRTVERDLSRSVGAPVSVRLLGLDAVVTDGIGTLAGICLDELDVAAAEYGLNPELLALDGHGAVSEAVFSDLLRTRCPVTNQPDVGSIYIRYAGPRIDHAALLRYLVSYREHAAFHEETVERIFVDLLAHCRPQELAVAACFLRRGGIDINPVRATDAGELPLPRLARQ